MRHWEPLFQYCVLSSFFARCIPVTWHSECWADCPKDKWASSWFNSAAFKYHCVCLFMVIAEKTFPCSHCEKVLSSKNALQIHEKIHAGIKFPCDKCSKVYYTAMGLSEWPPFPFQCMHFYNFHCVPLQNGREPRVAQTYGRRRPVQVPALRIRLPWAWAFSLPLQEAPWPPTQANALVWALWKDVLQCTHVGPAHAESVVTCSTCCCTLIYWLFICGFSFVIDLWKRLGFIIWQSRSAMLHFVILHLIQFKKPISVCDDFMKLMPDVYHRKRM